MFKTAFVVLALITARTAAPAQEEQHISSVGDTLLDPERITITGSFEAPPRPTTLELAVRSIGDAIEQKRAAESAKSSLGPLWELSVWRYLPGGAAGDTMNSRVVADDDAFLTPAYLKLSGRQLDRQLKLSELPAASLFGR